MALLGCLGQAANIAQLAGVDVLGLLSMIVKSAQTVRRNEEECRRLATRATTIEDMLQRLLISKVIKHPETWKPILGLRDTLLRAYRLVISSQRSSYVYRFCMGCELADQFRSVQKDMDVYVDHLKILLDCIIYDELTVYWKAAMQEGAQVFVVSSANRLNRDDSSGTGNVQLAIHSSTVNTGHLPDIQNIVEEISENQSSRWCCWCPLKETDTAPNMDMLISDKQSGLKKFTFSQLAHATNNFSLEKEIGFGGSSVVYKARLHEGLEVAVKRASCEGKTQFHHFETELQLIPKLRHANVVKLLGYCIQKRERILVFEYMQNRSLESFIYGERAAETPLNWLQRSRIVEGVAQGALYLHKLCGSRIIHGDLKPGNILLDSEFNPKICDFGTSRALKPGADVDCTAIVTGSRGFIAPECMEEGCFSIKSDVYSFGATLLQIISGKKAPPPPLELSFESRNYGPLNKWAWDLRGENKLVEFIDPLLHDDPQTAEIIRWVQVALLCVQHDPEERPSMSDVLMMLSCDSINIKAPNRLAYCRS